MKGHSAEVGTVAMTQDGKLLVSGSDDKTLNVWDLERGRKLQTLKGHSDGVSEIVLTRDWRCAVSVAGRGLSEGSNDKTLKVWDLETGQNLRTLVGHTDKVKTVAVTPDGSCVVSGSDDKTLKVWDLATGRELHTFRGHAEGVRSVIVTPDGKRTVSVSNDKTLRVWDLQAGTPLAVFTADSHVIVCAVDHNGKTLVAGDALGHVHFLSYEEDSAGLQSELRATGNEGTDYQDDESVQDQVERVATDLRKTGIVIFSLIASAFAVFTPVDFLLLHRWLRSLPLWILAVGAIITAMLELALALSALYFVLRHGPKRKPSLHEGFAEDRPWEPGSLENRAALYFDQGRYRKAARLYRKELKQSERVRGADHPDTLLLANSLANCYYSQGRYGDAEPFYMRTLEAMERVLGTDHSNTLTVLINLAALYYDQNRYEEAEPLYRRAVETLERLLGGEHPDTLTALSRLAELYCNQGRFGEAEPLYVQALETSEQTLGADHPDLLAALSNLASLNYRQGRYEEAGQLFGRALDSMERALGPEHSNTLRLVNNLGNSYQGQRRFGEAELLHRRAFETSERVLGAEHPETLIPLISLASLYCNQGRFGDAEPVYRQALESLERALGAEPSSALTAAHLTSMISMADALTRNGRNGDVRVLCRLSTGHSDVNPLQLRQLALACYHGGCYAEALNLLGRVLDRGFEIAATHIHIARVLVMMDLMNEAQQHVHLAREHSGADTPYVNQRILFFETLFAALRDRQPDEILQALAVEFSRPENFMEWRLEMLLEHIRYKLTLENITLLIALSHVINNRNAMPEIEAQPAWRRAVLRG
jgi:tetratricopeptide (TPR) repeat protein